MKKAFSEHPWAGVAAGFVGVLGLKVVTDFVFNMAVFIVDSKRSKRESIEDDVKDSYFQDEQE